MTAGRVKAGRALVVFGIWTAAVLAGASPARAEPPANDAFANAAALPVALPASQNGSNLEAGKEAGEPDHAGNAGGHSVWYSWTPSTSGPVGIRSGGCFSNLDALIGVYTGSAVNTLTPVADNESPTPPGCPFSEPALAEFEAAAGTTYWIAVDGRNGAEGSFQLEVIGPPANDDFVAAATINAEPPEWVSGSTRLAGKQAGEPDHAGDPGGHSVWYSWTPSFSGPVIVSTCSPFSPLDALLAVYTGSTIDALTQVAANDDGPTPGGFPECWWTDSEVRLDVSAGTTYRIAVDAAGGRVGRFNLRLLGRPANDDFANPQVLAPTASTGAQGNTQLATKEAGEPNHAGNAGGHSVWLSWTPNSSGPVSISTCGGSEELQSVLAVYTGADLGDLTSVAADAAGPTSNCSPSGSEVHFNATLGTTYRIAVDGKDGSEGRFQLSLSGAAANDAFAAAQDLGSNLPAYGFGSTRLASKEAGEPNHAGQVGGHSLWFKWTAPATGPAQISACPYGEGPFEPVLGLYTGSAVNSLTAVPSDENVAPSCGQDGSAVRFSATAGSTYRIAVDGSSEREGIFGLEINGRPANDDFAGAESLSAEPMFAGGSTIFATKQAGEPDHVGNPGGHSVWFSWTPSSSGPVDLYACGSGGSGVDTVLAVYTGSSVSDLTAVAGNDDLTGSPTNDLCKAGSGDSEVEFTATAGTTYRIAVDGKNGGEGSFSLAFERGPGNDDFDSSTTLSGGLPLYGSGETKFAGKQSGEPDHAGDSGGHSVWYSWTPSSGGRVAISTCTHGDLDTLLAVYTGPEVGDLTPVASNDDGPSECRSTDSEVEFTATAGTTYRIAVDGNGGSWGHYQLIAEGAQPNDYFGKARPLGSGVPRWEVASNRFATKQTGEPHHAGDPGGASVWFKWTAPRSGTFSADTCGSNFDTLLALYTGSAVETLTPVQNNDDAGGKCGDRSRLTFAAVANTVYELAVDGKDGAEGAIQLRIDGSPANDDLAKAGWLPSSLTFFAPGWNRLATKEASEPDHGGDSGGASVWFSWTAPQGGSVRLSTCSSDFEPVLGIYTGVAVGALAAVPVAADGTGGCAEGSGVVFSAAGGTTYEIAVDGSGGESGHFELEMEPIGPPTRTLTVGRAGSGAGSVAIDPAGIDCGGVCSQAFGRGTAVTLSATPNPGSSFVGWSGGGCSGSGSCTVVLHASVAMTAIFEAIPQSSGGGGQPVVAPPTSPKAPRRPLKCKRGFRQKLVHGKRRCVRKKVKKKHRR